MTDDKAIVLFSGGQDSTVCLAWALEHFSYVETIGFDYGQRHAVEMACRSKVRDAIAKNFPDWAGRLGADHRLDLGFLAGIGDTALTEEREIAFDASGLPNTFVPGRNLVFFTAAAATAYRRGIRHIVGGMCETDFSGYPDCRDDTLKALQVAINLGMDQRFVIETPLMWIDKAATFALASKRPTPAISATAASATTGATAAGSAPPAPCGRTVTRPIGLGSHHHPTPSNEMHPP